MELELEEIVIMLVIVVTIHLLRLLQLLLTDRNQVPLRLRTTSACASPSSRATAPTCRRSTTPRSRRCRTSRRSCRARRARICACTGAACAGRRSNSQARSRMDTGSRSTSRPDSSRRILFSDILQILLLLLLHQLQHHRLLLLLPLRPLPLQVITSAASSTRFRRRACCGRARTCARSCLAPTSFPRRRSLPTSPCAAARVFGTRLCSRSAASTARWWAASTPS